MKTIGWRYLAVVTALFLAFAVNSHLGTTASGSDIKWTYRSFVSGYPVTMFFGLIFWHIAARKTPASLLFRIAAGMIVFLPLTLLLVWTFWLAGFGDAFISTVQHLGIAAISTSFMAFSYLLFHRSIRFAWVNVISLGGFAALEA